MAQSQTAHKLTFWSEHFEKTTTWLYSKNLKWSCQSFAKWFNISCTCWRNSIILLTLNILVIAFLAIGVSWKTNTFLCNNLTNKLQGSTVYNRAAQHTMHIPTFVCQKEGTLHSNLLKIPYPDICKPQQPIQQFYIIGRKDVLFPTCCIFICYTLPCKGQKVGLLERGGGKIALS